MKRIIRLTESDLARIVRRVIKEGSEPADNTLTWNSTIGAKYPELKVVEGTGGYDFNLNPVEGHFNLVTPYNNQSYIYFKCNSPIAIWKGGASIFDKNTQKSDYDNAYNILKKDCTETIERRNARIRQYGE